MAHWLKSSFVMLASNVASAHVISAPLLIQLIASAPGKASQDRPSVWVLATHMEAQMEHLASGFSLAQIWLLWPFGKLTSGWKISLNLPLSVTCK